jgi:hypothetical protein
MTTIATIQTTYWSPSAALNGSKSRCTDVLQHVAHCSLTDDWLLLLGVMVLCADFASWFQAHWCMAKEILSRARINSALPWVSQVLHQKLLQLQMSKLLY